MQYQILYYVISIYEIILMVRILLSWINPDPHHPVVDWLYRLTDPVLEPIRRIMPGGGMGIDFSPMIVILVLDLIKKAIVGQGTFY